MKVLAEGGRPQDSHLTRLYGFADRMPVFALSYLLDALTASGDTGPRAAELQRRIRERGDACEGGSAHVEELSDPYLLWFWNSNVRSTAIVLGSLVRRAPDDPLVPGLVRWLLAARKQGRWSNTQENGVGPGGARRLLQEGGGGACRTSAPSVAARPRDAGHRGVPRPNHERAGRRTCP